MKRGGRTLDHATLETIRKMAVQRVREGERPSDVIASFGMHRCTIYGWLKAVRGRGHGLKALAAKPASGRPRTLTAAQERQVFRWINGKNPMQIPKVMMEISGPMFGSASKPKSPRCLL